MDQPTRTDEIVAHLRDGITSGELVPGMRLPTRLDLQDSFATSSGSVQHALDQLIADGFVVARGRNGTFVVDHPPHRSRFILAVRGRHGDPGWNEFWAALCRAAASPPWRGGARRVETVCGFDSHEDDPTVRETLRLAGVGAVAGVLHSSPPEADAERWRRIAVPQAAITRADPGEWTGAALTLDDDAVVDLALRRIAALGARRVAVLMFGGYAAAVGVAVAACVAKHGLTTRESWIHGCLAEPDARRWLGNWVSLLFAGRPEERPQALLIADDNLVADASAGLRALGDEVVARVAVVAHANFPDPTPCAVPALRVGFDAGEIVAAGVALLGRVRDGARGERVAITPRFADGWQAG